MNGSNRSELLQLVARLQREREDARHLLADIRDAGAWDREIPAEWRTAGVVQEILAEAAAELESSPARSLSLAQLALAVVSSIPSDRYSPIVLAMLTGSAWKEISTAHRYMSRYEEALHALDRADAQFASSAALGHDVAVIALCRAVVFAEMRRDDDAIRLLRQTTPVFRSYGDQRRLTHATVLLAMIHHRRGDLERALEIYESLTTKAGDDLHTLAAIYNNLGRVRTSLGNHAGAVDALQKSRALFNDLGMPAEITRTSWALARVLMETGDWQRATLMLKDVRDDFRKRNMPEEAGLAALDLVECHLTANDVASARALAEIVTAEFTQARLNARALTALAYLRESLSQPVARPAVRHVRDYIEALKQEPERAFLPLP